MTALSETWFAEGYIDFELKKYTLLAYLQEINRYFSENKLYPQLGDVVFHYNNLRAFRENKQFLQQHFPKRLTAVNLEKLQLLYEQMIADDELMEELENIIQYALQKIDNTIRDGAEIYEFVEEQLNIAPVGIIPLDINEGYMLLNDGRASDTLVYQYRLTIFERHDERFRGIHTQYISTYTRGLSQSYQSIKTDLIRHRAELPNPAVYTIETDLVFPVAETLQPIAKRSLVKYITTAS
ncbi:hypothetical protein ACWKWU_03760 [Chitinophaga lutea]